MPDCVAAVSARVSVMALSLKADGKLAKSFQD